MNDTHKRVNKIYWGSGEQVLFMDRCFYLRGSRKARLLTGSVQYIDRLGINQLDGE